MERGIGDPTDGGRVEYRLTRVPLDAGSWPDGQAAFASATDSPPLPLSAVRVPTSSASNAAR